MSITHRRENDQFDCRHHPNQSTNKVSITSLNIKIFIFFTKQIVFSGEFTCRERNEEVFIGEAVRTDRLFILHSIHKNKF